MTSDKDIERGPEPPKMIQNPNGTYPVAIKNPAWEKWDEGRGSRLKAEMKGMDAIQKRFDAPPSYGLPPAYLLGSPKLNNFMDGLETAQGGPDNSHTTVIGHSYGSTVVGDASNKGDLSADDIVVAGSPGMLTGDADDLDVGKDHVWSEAASDDFVPAGGKIAGLGGYKWGVETWNGIPYNAGYVQTVPSDEAFGAHRMDVDTSGHSDYWTRDSQSLKNQASVVVGQYERVEEDD